MAAFLYLGSKNKVDNKQTIFKEFMNDYNEMSSLEEKHEEKIKILKWEKVDVLFSPLGICVLGLYACDCENEESSRLLKLSESKKVIQLKNNSRQRFYSRKYIMGENGKGGIINEYLDENGNDFSCLIERLNKMRKLQDFFKKYFLFGNLIPMWPGGNQSRGCSWCYDLPQLYFQETEVEPRFEKLKERYNTAALEYIFEDKFNFAKKFKDIADLLENFNVETYKNLLKYAVKTIDIRERKLQSLLQSKS